MRFTDKSIRHYGISLILLAVVSSAYFGNIAIAADEAVTSPTPPPAYPVNIAIVEEKEIQLWKEFSGRLSAVDYVEVRPQASGIITEVKFDDGQMVKKGDILYVIDPEPLKMTVRQKKATLLSAKTSHDLANKEYTRAQDLLNKKMVSQQYYDERLNTKLLTSSAVNEAKAELAQAEIDLRYAYIKAPISGRISRAELTEGNLVSTGASAPLLTTIVSLGKVYADFHVDEETYINYVHEQSMLEDKTIQNPVELTLQSGDTYRGKIHAFDNMIDVKSGTIRARAIFENPNGTLLPGMYAHLKLGNVTPTRSILINERAIATDQNRKYVYIVNTDKQATYREVTVGSSIKGQRIITSGLKAGDKVIIEGLMRIRPGMLVAPTISSQATAKPAQS